MRSQRSHEGYLLLDSNGGPGLTEAQAHATGMPRAVVNSGRTEVKTYTCSHCQKVVILRPERIRERAYCPKCDHRICDGCGALRAMNGGACRTFKQLIEETQEAAVRQAQRGSIIIPA